MTFLFQINYFKRNNNQGQDITVVSVSHRHLLINENVTHRYKNMPAVHTPSFSKMASLFPHTALERIALFRISYLRNKFKKSFRYFLVIQVKLVLVTPWTFFCDGISNIYSMKQTQRPSHYFPNFRS